MVLLRFHGRSRSARPPRANLSRSDKLWSMKFWCLTLANWNTLPWKQQSGTHRAAHLGFSFFLPLPPSLFPRVTSCFAGGAIFTGCYIRCDSCSRHNVLFSLFYFPFTWLQWGAECTASSKPVSKQSSEKLPIFHPAKTVFRKIICELVASGYNGAIAPIHK